MLKVKMSCRELAKIFAASKKLFTYTYCHALKHVHDYGFKTVLSFQVNLLKVKRVVCWKMEPCLVVRKEEINGLNTKG